jgi:MoxR-like ATPase
MSNQFIFYGKKGNSSAIKEILDHMFQRNSELQEAGEKGTPICIWGTHGLGKTHMVKDFAKERDWQFRYIAPAQFEEMGDLHGMPNVIDPDPSKSGDEYTVYSPPEWVPTEEGPGILLLDDMNRADDRILRGCMQLLQNFELSSWKLPQKWQIVATANPEGGDYSVTPMDGAMITRMLHVTLEFDAKIWAQWAEKAKVDPRGIAFVLTYPEIVNTERTTPRSLCQFFSQIQTIQDLKSNIHIVEAIALSSLDEIAVASFLRFINNDLNALIEPEEILNAADFSDVKKKIVELSVDGTGTKRLDILSTICTRVYLKLLSENYKPEAVSKANLIQFLQLEEIPNDLLMSLYMDLSKYGNDTIKEMIRDNNLAIKLLKTL